MVGGYIRRGWWRFAEPFAGIYPEDVGADLVGFVAGWLGYLVLI